MEQLAAGGAGGGGWSGFHGVGVREVVMIVESWLASTVPFADAMLAPRTATSVVMGRSMCGLTTLSVSSLPLPSLGDGSRTAQASERLHGVERTEIAVASYRDRFVCKRVA